MVLNEIEAWPKIVFTWGSARGWPSEC